MNRRRRIAGVAAGAALTGWLASPVHAQTVSVWLTTNTQTAKLQPQPAVTFGASATSTNPIVVDQTRTYQEIEGFGASMTDSSAYLLNQIATPAGRDAAMANLFTRAGTGIGLSVMRNPMGASDLARSHYSYDDLPAGQTDPTLANFSIAHDMVDIVPLVQQARALNPQLTIMATPWSPPGWMKSSGSLIGGSLLASAYAPFANYFVKYIQAYQAVGIPIDYISLQNEPLFVPGDYPGMSMDAVTQLAVLKQHLLPALTSAGLSTRALVYDHNWDRPDYPDTVLADQVLADSPQVAGIAWHGYGGTPGAMLALHDKYPQKGQYQAEHSGGTWVSDQVRADFPEIIHVMRSWGRAFVKWGLALDQNRGPHAGGCGTCTPLVTVSSASGAVSYPIDFYTLGHFSKFVLPGARRIYSSNGNGVLSVAFLNPDGSNALVAFNDTRTSKTFQVRWGTRSFAYTLAGYAGATFTWTGAQTGDYAVAASTQMQASSFTTSSGLQTETCTDSNGGLNVGYADDGDQLVFKQVNFPGTLGAVDVRVASAGSGGRIDIRIGAPEGPLIASVTVPITGGWQSWRTVSSSMSGVSGVHDVYLVFDGTTSIGNVNWFRFR
ncbi:MAG: carbohydrate-binding protein [Vicinamibacteria bacterium]|nr:carbohydrate-binding protein [Vicinamibacteria bacterium]